MGNIIIRNESEKEYAKTEEIHREAFWNLNEPGCCEHYLAHILRKHSDFILPLDYVAELNGEVVANIMYSKAKLIDETGNEKEIVTFGPFAVKPDYQKKGIGKKILEKSLEEAKKMGYGAVVIFGNPDYYVLRGFKSCQRYNVCMQGDIFPSAMLVKELVPGFFDGKKYYFCESEVFQFDRKLSEEFDKNFKHKEKKVLLSQEGFYIRSRSVIIQ